MRPAALALLAAHAAAAGWWPRPGASADTCACSSSAAAVINAPCATTRMCGPWFRRRPCHASCTAGGAATATTTMVVTAPCSSAAGAAETPCGCTKTWHVIPTPCADQASAQDTAPQENEQAQADSPQAASSSQSALQPEQQFSPQAEQKNTCASSHSTGNEQQYGANQEQKQAFSPNTGNEQPYSSNQEQKQSFSPNTGNEQPYSSNQEQKHSNSPQSGSEQPYGAEQEQKQSNSPQQGNEQQYNTEQEQKQSNSPQSGSEQQFGTEQEQKNTCAPSAQEQQFGTEQEQKQAYSPNQATEQPYSSNQEQKQSYSPQQGNDQQYGTEQEQKQSYSPQQGNEQQYETEQEQKQSYSPQEDQYSPKNIEQGSAQENAECQADAAEAQSPAESPAWEMESDCGCAKGVRQNAEESAAPDYGMEGMAPGDAQGAMQAQQSGPQRRRAADYTTGEQACTTAEQITSSTWTSEQCTEAPPMTTWSVPAVSSTLSMTDMWPPSASESCTSSLDSAPTMCPYNLTMPQYANVSEIFSLENDANQTDEAAKARQFCDAVGEGLYCYSPSSCVRRPGKASVHPSPDDVCMPTVMISCPDAVFLSCRQWYGCVQRDLRFAAQCVAVQDAVDDSLLALNPTPAVRLSDGRPVLLFSSVVTETLLPSASSALMSFPTSMPSYPTSMPYQSSMTAGTAMPLRNGMGGAQYSQYQQYSSARRGNMASYGCGDSSVSSATPSYGLTTYTTTSAYVPTYCAGPNAPLLNAWMASLSSAVASMTATGSDALSMTATESYVTGTALPAPSTTDTSAPACTVY